MDIALQGIPENIPQDLTKLRIENSHLTEIPPGSFCNVSSLEYLWLNFNDITIISVHSLEGLNNLTELRLQGNKLRSVPWTAFQDTPVLKILDLKHNRLDVLPEFSLKYLPSLTYLDLSFNLLTVISKEVFLNWPLYLRAERRGNGEESSSNVVLALHDNPWICDCRLKGFVQFIKALSPPIILMNSYLKCSGPEPRYGKFFHEVELKTCTEPVATAPITNITVPLRANITLTCIAKGRPNPNVWWAYGLKTIRRFNESQTRVDEDTIQSNLAIPSLHLSEVGTYICMAVNFLGNSSAIVLVNAEATDLSIPLSSAFHLGTAEESAHIDVRITEHTVHGVTLEWHSAAGTPPDTWYTLHFGRYGTAKKGTVYIGPGINTYTFTELLPATQYEICVALRNQAPRSGRCIVFVTGSDVRDPEQRKRLIHIAVIVCGMVLAVPMGMYACTTETRFGCFSRCAKQFRGWRHKEETVNQGQKQDNFDSLQVTSDQGVCQDTNKENPIKTVSEKKTRKPRSDGRSTAGLY
ncbi:hypothetical protein JZ751_019791 [Albula glossodonta]|uniref:Leucine rich repeat, Ig-like and transmembrane domains 2 n=1 Tax=Albula glossodonta TaxID=121402 RepID=A0A8T2NXA9_9TELE|nr:hypothetical protein JZ751_019791 [Albula glossodonta]